MRVLFLIESDCLPPVRAVRDVSYSEWGWIVLAGAAVYADSPERAEAGKLYRLLGARACPVADALCSPYSTDTVAEQDRPAKVVLFHYNPDRKA